MNFVTTLKPFLSNCQTRLDRFSEESVVYSTISGVRMFKRHLTNIDGDSQKIMDGTSTDLRDDCSEGAEVYWTILEYVCLKQSWNKMRGGSNKS